LETHAFIFSHGDLVLEGLIIERLAAEKPGKEYPALVHTWKPSLYLSHCRFVARGRCPAVTLWDPVGSTVINCEFQGNLSGAVGWHYPLRGEFVMENCVAVTNWSCCAVL